MLYRLKMGIVQAETEAINYKFMFDNKFMNYDGI